MQQTDTHHFMNKFLNIYTSISQKFCLSLEKGKNSTTAEFLTFDCDVI